MRHLYALKLAVLLLLLSGCSLYVPMLPAAPQLRDKGQIELHANSYLNRRVEAGATYSPAKHMLVRAAGGLRTSAAARTDSGNYQSSRQYELAAGGYLPLGSDGLISGLVGFGQARSSSAYSETFNRSPRYYNDFRARYHRPFGELAASYYLPGRRSGFMLGVAYRLSSIRFDALTYNGQLMEIRRLMRQEPMIFCRFGSPQSVIPGLRFQLAVGTSSEFRRTFDPTRPYAEAKVREEIPYLAVSMVILPHLLRAPKPPSTPLP